MHGQEKSLNIGDKVETEWGHGVIGDITGRSVTIILDAAPGFEPVRVNIQRGTPGFRRLIERNLWGM